MPDIRPKLLIVEDDPGLQRQLRWSYDEYQLLMAGDREEALEILRAEMPPVVTLDLGLPPDVDGTSEGFATLTEILKIAPATKVVVASGHGERESARQSIALGAWDFYQKPIDLDSLRHIVARAFHVHRLELEHARNAERAPEDHVVLGGLVTAAPEMVAVARMIERAASAPVSVMLLGASGTGKRMIARALHDGGSRRGGPFVALDCADHADPLLESGLLNSAAGGTLFLGAVDAVPLTTQARLLSLLDTSAGDARILCASTCDMEAMVAAGQFRADLYHRLSDIIVRIPSLAERAGDPALLARHFVARHAARLNPHVSGLAPDATAAIDAWHWPGNVRELDNRVKRAVVLAEGRMITARDLDLAEPASAVLLNLKAAREQADRQAIRHALARSGGNVSAAAKLLGISRPALYELMKGYGITG